MKGIILAGGTGTRLYPLTRAVSKQLRPGLQQADDLLPAVHADAGGDPGDSGHHHARGSGRLPPAARRRASSSGCEIAYAASPAPRGSRRRSSSAGTSSAPIAVALALGDNIFYGDRLRGVLTRGGVARQRRDRVRRTPCAIRNATAWWSSTPKTARSASRKSRRIRKSPYAVTGLYFYDNDVLDIAADLRPSARGELEITDVNRAYLERGDLQVQVFGRGVAWLDTGTLRVAAAGVAVRAEHRGSPGADAGVPRGDRAGAMGYITTDQLLALAVPMRNNAYGDYLAASRTAGPAAVMRVIETALAGVIIVEPQVHRDARGFFVETYHAERLASCGITDHLRAGQPLALGAGYAARPALAVPPAPGQAGAGGPRRDLRRGRRHPPRIADLRGVGRRAPLGRQPPADVHPRGIRATDSAC